MPRRNITGNFVVDTSLSRAIDTYEDPSSAAQFYESLHEEGVPTSDIQRNATESLRLWSRLEDKIPNHVLTAQRTHYEKAGAGYRNSPLEKMLQSYNPRGATSQADYVSVDYEANRSPYTTVVSTGMRD